MSWASISSHQTSSNINSPNYVGIAELQRQDLLESLASFMRVEVKTGRSESAQNLVRVANIHGYPSVSLSDVLDAASLPCVADEFTVLESTIKPGSYRIHKKDTPSKRSQPILKSIYSYPICYRCLYMLQDARFNWVQNGESGKGCNMTNSSLSRVSTHMNYTIMVRVPLYRDARTVR
jgi:hypothetical protein